MKLSPPLFPPHSEAGAFTLGVLLTFGIIIFAMLAPGCLRSVSATPGTTPDGRPMVDFCAEVMASAKAAPTSAPSAVATVLPSTQGRGAL